MSIVLSSLSVDVLGLTGASESLWASRETLQPSPQETQEIDKVCAVGLLDDEKTVYTGECISSIPNMVEPRKPL